MGETLTEATEISIHEVTEFLNQSGYANLIRSITSGTTVLNATLETLDSDMAKKLTGYKTSETNDKLAEQIPVFTKIVGIEESDIEKLKLIMSGEDFSGRGITYEWFDQIKEKLNNLVEGLLQLNFAQEDILQNIKPGDRNN